MSPIETRNIDSWKTQVIHSARTFHQKIGTLLRMKTGTQTLRSLTRKQTCVRNLRKTEEECRGA